MSHAPETEALFERHKKAYGALLQLEAQYKRAVHEMCTAAPLLERVTVGELLVEETIALLEEGRRP